MLWSSSSSGTLSHTSGLGWALGRILDEGSFHLKSENKLGAWKRPKKMESPLDWTWEKDGKEGQAVTCAFTGETRESMGEIKTEPLTSFTSHLDQHSQSLLYRLSSSSIPPPHPHFHPDIILNEPSSSRGPTLLPVSREISRNI